MTAPRVSSSPAHTVHPAEHVEGGSILSGGPALPSSGIALFLIQLVLVLLVTRVLSGILKKLKQVGRDEPSTSLWIHCSVSNLVAILLTVFSQEWSQRFWVVSYWAPLSLGQSQVTCPSSSRPLLWSPLPSWPTSAW
jgi:hypothetical protein